MEHKTESRATFRTWLLSRTEEHSPVGDLARDTEADLDCWEGTSSRSFLSHIVEEHQACDGAVKAFEDAVARYRAGEN